MLYIYLQSGLFVLVTLYGTVQRLNNSNVDSVEIKNTDYASNPVTVLPCFLSCMTPKCYKSEYYLKQLGRRNYENQFGA